MTRFTGWHMTAIIVGFFGVVIAVNIVMATLAVTTFSGTVVDDSHAASQKFNQWLDDARRQDAAGWDADIARLDTGRVRVTLHVPAGLSSAIRLTGSATLALGRAPERPLTFERHGNVFITAHPLPAGRWVARIAVVGGEGTLARFEQDLHP